MKNINWVLEGAIGILTINNPPQNYIEEPEFINLEQLQELVNTDTLKGIIIQGKGRHFSAGANVKNIAGWAIDDNSLFQRLERGKQVLDYLESLYIPVIAAISGTCFGAGLEIALACHIRVCGANTLLAFPEVNHNLIPGLGGTIRLSRLSEIQNSIQILLNGDIINSNEAIEQKIVDHIVPSKQVMNFSKSLMKKMTDDRPINVIHSVLKALWNANTMKQEDAMKEETKMFCELAIEEAQKQHPHDQKKN